MRHLNGFLVGAICFWTFGPLPAADPPKEDLTRAELKLLGGNWCLSAYRVDGVEFPKELLKKVKVTISGQTLQVKPNPVHRIDVKTGKTTVFD